MYDDKEIGRNRESSIPFNSLSPNQPVPAKFPIWPKKWLPVFQSGPRNGSQSVKAEEAVERNEEIDYFALVFV